MTKILSLRDVIASPSALPAVFLAGGGRRLPDPPWRIQAGDLLTTVLSNITLCWYLTLTPDKMYYIETTCPPSPKLGESGNASCQMLNI
ncbi:MAG: hypothetical protein ACHQQQ_08350 [Bacteroidota bacterium]